MSTCPKCGATTNAEDIFCGACGLKLAAMVPQAPNNTMLTQKELKAIDIRFNLGVVYFKMGKYDQAMETFEKILQEEPNNIRVLDMCERIREARQKAGMSTKLS